MFSVQNQPKMVMESGQNQGRFWPLSPRLWRRSNEYSKVVFEPRKPPLSPIEFRRKDRIDVTPDLLRSRSFIKDRLDHLNLEEVGFEKRWSVAKPPIKEKEKKEEVVKLRVKKQRQARPNSLQLLLCPSSSGHYSSSTWRYTRVRSKRFVSQSYILTHELTYFFDIINISVTSGNLLYLLALRERGVRNIL